MRDCIYVDIHVSVFLCFFCRNFGCSINNLFFALGRIQIHTSRHNKLKKIFIFLSELEQGEWVLRCVIRRESSNSLFVLLKLERVLTNEQFKIEFVQSKDILEQEKQRKKIY